MQGFVKITDRQKALADLVILRAATGCFSTRAELMRMVGYGWATIDRKSAQVFRSAGFRAALAQNGCRQDKVAKVLTDALEATQCIKTHTGEQETVPDHEVRLKTVKMLLSLIL